jgi:hypothetical protein
MATRVIAAQDKTSSGAGDDVQIKAGSANTSGAGGSIIIQPGAQATSGGNGIVIVRQPGGTAGTDEIQLSHDGSKGFLINKDGTLQLGGANIAIRNVANNANTTLTATTLYATGIYSSNVINADGVTIDSYSWGIDSSSLNWGQDFNLRVGWSHIKGYANCGIAYTGNNTNGRRATLEVTDGSTGGGAWAYRSATTTVNTSYNDLNLTGHSAFQRLNATAATTITGIAPASTAGGVGAPTWIHTDGRIFWLYNVGTFNVTLANESASSTAGNRVTTQTGANVVLGPGRMMQIVYDGTSSRWRTSGETYPYVFPTADGTNGQVLTTNGSGALSWTTVSSSGGTVTSVSGTGTVNGITLTGTVTSSGSLTLGGTLSGVSLATQVTGTLPIANGGTGTTTAQLAINALAGAVTSGSYLRGNGTNVVMAAIQAADVPTLNQNTTGTASGSVSGTASYLAKFTGTNVVGNSQIVDNGTSVIINGTSTNSAQKLVVKDGNLFFDATAGSNNPQIWSWFDSSTLTVKAGTTAGYVAGIDLVSGTSGYQAFSTASSEKMRVTSAGNVGIGTASPSSKLDVSGTVTATSININNSSSQYLNFSTNGTGRWQIYHDGSGSLRFLDNVWDNTDRMIIGNGGNIVMGASASLDKTGGPKLLITTGPDSAGGTGAARRGLVVKGSASQTANLTEWQDNTGAVVAAVSPNGAFTGSSFTPYGTFNSTTTIFGNNYWTPNYTGGVTSPSAGTYTKSTGSANVWNGQVYSSEGYTKNVYCAARASQINGNLMFGLNNDPATDGNYSSLDYAWYFLDNATLMIYENGAQGASYGAYTTSTVLSITYDGSNVQYWKDGVIQRTVARSTGNPLYFDTSFYTLSSSLNSVQFGPIGQPFGISGTSGYLPKFTSQQTLGNSIVYDSGTNVGVGTASPADRLEVSGATNKNVKIGTVAGGLDTSSYNPDISTLGGIVGFQTGISTDYRGSIYAYADSSSNAKLAISSRSDIVFISYKGNNADSRAMVIKETTGNVGIGTASPSFKLQVDAASVDANIVANVTSGYGGIGVYAAGTNKVILGYVGANNNYGSQTVTGDIALKTNNSNLHINTGSGNSVTTAYFSSTGNVGIGNVSPGARLQVDTGATGTKGLLLKAVASQSANLLEIQNNAGVVLTNIDSNGHLTVSTTTSAYTYYSSSTTTRWATGHDSSNGYFRIIDYVWDGTTRLMITPGGNVVLGNAGGDQNNGPKLLVTTGPDTTGGTGAARKGLIVRGSGSQTANLQEWQNSSSTALAYMDANGNFFAVSKSFLIPHPTPVKAAEGKKLRYASLEGPENGVYFRGRLDGENEIVLPDYWVDLVDPESITVSLTARKFAQPSLFVVDANAEKVVVESDREINCDFVVFATRRDIAKLEVEPDGE